MITIITPRRAVFLLTGLNCTCRGGRHLPGSEPGSGRHPGTRRACNSRSALPQPPAWKPRALCPSLLIKPVRLWLSGPCRASACTAGTCVCTCVYTALCAYQHAYKHGHTALPMCGCVCAGVCTCVVCTCIHNAHMSCTRMVTCPCMLAYGVCTRVCAYVWRVCVYTGAWAGCVHTDICVHTQICAPYKHVHMHILQHAHF